MTWNDLVLILSGFLGAVIGGVIVANIQLRRDLRISLLREVLPQIQFGATGTARGVVTQRLEDLVVTTLPLSKREQELAANLAMLWEEKANQPAFPGVVEEAQTLEQRETVAEFRRIQAAFQRNLGNLRQETASRIKWWRNLSDSEKRVLQAGDG